ncbi:hypothetical protein A3A40_00045 [Candidatus Kaiserbacteria bacterium RIFCSPLOWO2_01_FULL_54_20]|uniref:Uncharacterized protein n=1 Tax=Candidatus Kaiserbacteria bacterium RIFCSPLOWO2_01_FULL_54_20 TaxID=1798513 RepID=A0A1F6EIR9_9BACT|nr:MAG: hypothetical protein A3A40_00045 [Candidatus Kaiserbacteria bacterium RIFCSPLOWO2_01_FULL_54_20]
MADGTGGFMSRIPNPLKHAEPRPKVVTAELNVGELRSAHRNLQNIRNAVGVDPAQQANREMHLRVDKRKIELAENMDISCSIEAPQGWKDISTDAKHSNYKSDPFKVVFTVEENGETRQFETMGYVYYRTQKYDRPEQAEEREQVDRLGVKPQYWPGVYVDELPWPDDPSAEKKDGFSDVELKRRIAGDVFRKAMGNVLPGPFEGITR